MEAIGFSETVVTTYETIRCHIQGDHKLNLMDSFFICVSSVLYGSFFVNASLTANGFS
jgi:hypothetical protein